MVQLVATSVSLGNNNPTSTWKFYAMSFDYLTSTVTLYTDNNSEIIKNSQIANHDPI